MKHLRLALALLTLITVGLLLGEIRYFGVFDFLPLWGGVHVFLDGGDPYDFALLKSNLSSQFSGLPPSQHFVSPPWTLAFLVPLFAGDFASSRVLLILLSLFAFYLSLIRLQKLWGPLPRLGAVVVWGYLPLWACLFYGQLSAFLLLGTILALEWLNSPQRPWWKWALSMTLFALKPQGFILVFPFLVGEFLQRASRRDLVCVMTYTALLCAVMSPCLLLIPSWLDTASFSYSQNSATLSNYVRVLGESLGMNAALSLWILPVLAFGFLARGGLHLNDSYRLQVVMLASQLTAPYIWVYDSCALMPLFYASIVVLTRESLPPKRRACAVLSTTLLVLPAYLALAPGFKDMFLHNVALAGALLALSPEIKRYLGRTRYPLNV